GGGSAGRLLVGEVADGVEQEAAMLRQRLQQVRPLTGRDHFRGTHERTVAPGTDSFPPEPPHIVRALCGYGGALTTKCPHNVRTGQSVARAWRRSTRAARRAGSAAASTPPRRPTAA